MHNLDCSQIEDRDEEEITDWYDEDELKRQWKEGETMDVTLEKRKWMKVYGKWRLCRKYRSS